MDARKVAVTLKYNGADAPAPNAFSYTDVASGSSDSISIGMNDRERKWIGPWFPVKGDTLQPFIRAENWEFDGNGVGFSCGTFHVDDFSFSGGPPRRLNIEALAVPTDSSFKTTERTITYEDATLQEIGQEVADRAGVQLFYEGPIIAIARVEQNNQTDCDFFNGLVKLYGLALKIFNDKLVVFSEAIYESNAAKARLTEADFEPSWTWNTKMVGTYTGVKYQYTNSDKNMTFTVEAGGGDRILTCNAAADNLTEATAIALAALNEANKGTTTMSITLKASLGLIASDCVEIVGLGKLSGKYYIEQIVHNIGSGYTMSLSLRKVEQRFTEATNVSSSAAEGK